MIKNKLKNKTFLAVDKACLNRGLKSLDLLLIAQIEEFQRNECVCYMTNEQLSAAFGESICTVKRRLDKLEDLNIISRKTTFINGNGKGTRQRTLMVNDKSEWKDQFESESSLESSNESFDRSTQQECKEHIEPIKNNIKNNIKDKYSIDVIENVISLYKNKTKYKVIQSKVIETFQLEISFDEIYEIISNIKEYVEYIDQVKSEKYRRQNESKYTLYQYNKIADVIETLNKKGIAVKFEDMKNAYDENINKNTVVKWHISELDDDCNLSLITEGMTFDEYIATVFDFKQNIQCGHWTN